MTSSLPRRQDATVPPAPADDAVGSAVAQLVGSAPETLDTLGELAAALTADEGTAATLTALIGTKAPLASPAFTGTVTGITAGMVGLGAVDNTPDSAKPVSTAQQAALNGKASTASPAFTGIVTGITAEMVAADPAGAASTAQAAAVQRANHTGTQTADTLTDGVLNKAYTGTERTKLAGIATGATANSADSALLNRANHTGTQAAATVTGLATVATSGAYADLTGKPADATPAAVTLSFSGTVAAYATGSCVAYRFGSLVVVNMDVTTGANGVAAAAGIIGGLPIPAASRAVAVDIWNPGYPVGTANCSVGTDGVLRFTLQVTSGTGTNSIPASTRLVANFSYQGT